MYSLGGGNINGMYIMVSTSNNPLQIYHCNSMFIYRLLREDYTIHIMHGYFELDTESDGGLENSTLKPMFPALMKC